MEQERTIAVPCSGPLSLLWTIRQEPRDKHSGEKKATPPSSRMAALS